MKIWMLTGETPSAAGGGIARYTDQMARALVAAGAEVVVFGPSDREADEMADGGYRVVSFDWPSLEAARQKPWREKEAAPSERSLSNDFAIAWKVAEMVGARAAAEGPPDVIESPEYKALGVFVKQRQLTDATFLPGVPLVVTLHTPDYVVRQLNHEPRFALPTYWTGVQERWLMRSADALVAPSAFIAGELAARENLALKSITVCPLPLEIDDEAEGDLGVDHNAGDPELVFFGRLELRKGIRELLLACERAWLAGRVFRLVLVGGTTTYSTRGVTVEEWIRKRYARWLEEGKLEVTGELPRVAAAERLQRAHAVVIPSLWENYPYSCLEALAAGTPVLATRQGGMVEMLGDEDPPGRVFDWDATDEFEKTLEWALGLDGEARREIGKRARARARSIADPAAIAARRLAHFRETVADWRPPVRFPFVSQDPTASPDRTRAEEETAGETTVVIPCYNLGEFLPEALASVEACGPNPPHVLVVDDGSTEAATRELLDTLEAERRPWLRILRKANGGLASARNAGAAAAETEFITFLDADDCLGPEFVCRSLELLGRYPNVDIVASWVQFFGADSGIWRGWNLELPYLLLHNLMVPICTVRRQPFLRYGQNRPAMEYGLEDLDGWISMLAAGCGGVVIPEALVRYRVREASMYRSINRAAYLYLYDTIAEGHPELMRRHGTELYQLLNANGPAHDFDMPTAWGTPYDALLRQESTRHRAALDAIERHWEETVALRTELQEAREAEAREWRTACDLRARLGKLDAEVQALRRERADRG